VAMNVLEENMLMIDRVSNKGLGILGGADAAIGRPQKHCPRARQSRPAALLAWCPHRIDDQAVRRHQKWEDLHRSPKVNFPS